jgi:hypothetical protein
MDFKAKIDGENHFEPISSEDFRLSLKLKIGDYIHVETWKKRNIDFHRKYFKLLNITIYFLPEDEKFDRFRNIDYLREELMIRIGEVNYHVDIDNNTHIRAKSINFKSMDNEKFQRIYTLSVDIILKHFLSHLTFEQFEKHLLNFI